MLAYGMPNEPRWHDTMGFVAIALDPGFVMRSLGGALPRVSRDLRPVRGEADQAIMALMLISAGVGFIRVCGAGGWIAQ